MTDDGKKIVALDLVALDLESVEGRVLAQRFVAPFGSLEVVEVGPSNPAARAAWKARNYHKHYGTVTTFKVDNYLEQCRRAQVQLTAFEAYAISIGVKVVGDSWEVTPEQHELLRVWREKNNQVSK